MSWILTKYTYLKKGDKKNYNNPRKLEFVYVEIDKEKMGEKVI